ncbi:MAG: hypothetical protein WC595_02700 [Candidatus Nanoarchaeia archaeon]
MVVEVELRTFLTEDRYNDLLAFFRKEGTFISEDNQETFYFDGKEDLRIQKNDFFSKIWVKKGKLHDEAREEIEIKVDKGDFEKLEKIFLAAGLNVQIKWLRKRVTFKWKNMDVMLDLTKGYGHILEIEKLVEDTEKERTLIELKKELQSLNIPLSSKEEFEKKYAFYKENWKNLI